jgi:hypothetical protein
LIGGFAKANIVEIFPKNLQSSWNVTLLIFFLTVPVDVPIKQSFTLDWNKHRCVLAGLNLRFSNNGEPCTLWALSNSRQAKNAGVLGVNLISDVMIF